MSKTPETRPALDIPTEDDIRLIIHESGFSNTSYPEFVVNILNERAPTVGEFTITQVPFGAAPHEIREKWVSLTLPVRCASVGLEEAVPVLAIEAILKLKDAGHKEAYDWWMEEYEHDTKQHARYSPYFPAFAAYIDFLIFREQEGSMKWLVPSEAE